MTTRIDRVINKVVRYQQLPCYWGIDSGASEVTKVEEKFEMLVEANDILLERVVRLQILVVKLSIDCQINNNVPSWYKYVVIL